MRAGSASHMRRFGLTCVLVALLAAPPLLGAQSETTVVGTLVDSACYLRLGEKDDHHDDQVACGAMCLTKGSPAGLVTRDGTFLVLVARSTELADYIGLTVRVTGSVTNGALLVDRVELKLDTGSKSGDPSPTRRTPDVGPGTSDSQVSQVGRGLLGPSRVVR